MDGGRENAIAYQIVVCHGLELKQSARLLNKLSEFNEEKYEGLQDVHHRRFLYNNVLQPVTFWEAIMAINDRRSPNVDRASFCDALSDRYILLARA